MISQEEKNYPSDGSGKFISLSHMPYVGLLIKNDDTCGISLVNEIFAFTCTECVYNINITYSQKAPKYAATVVFGTNDYPENKGEEHQVVYIEIKLDHDGKNGPFLYNIAVITVSLTINIYI